MAGRHWNRSEATFENFSIKQSYEFPDQITNLVMFVNNEDRALGLLKSEEISNIPNVHLIILNRHLGEYEDEGIDTLIQNVQEVLSSKQIELKIHFLNFYDENFSVHLTEILQKQQIFTNPLLLDITSCPPPVLIPLAEVLLSHQTRTLVYAYTVPESYNTELIREIDRDQVAGAEVKRYGKKENVNSRTLAIITGYEDQKAKLVHEAIEPDVGYLFNYLFTKDISELQKAKEIMELHKDMIEIEDYKQFNLNRYDVNRILNALLLLDSRNTTDVIIVAPFGSKVQRMASMLFVSKKPGRQIVDIIPNELSFKKISSGIETTLFYEVSRI